MIDPHKIWSSKHLPSLPAIAVELINLSDDPEAGISDIVELVRTDPAITAKILKVINSTFFGVSARVTSLERAVSLLGGTYVTSIALSFYLSDSASSKGPLAEHYSRYWLQSVVQAIAAELIGKRLQDRTESELFLAGLMMDLGRLAMLKAIPQEYAEVLIAAAEQSRDLYEIERETFGFDHTEIGARLIETWNLPETLRDLVRSHHCLPEEVTADSTSVDHSLHRALIMAAHVGDIFCAQNTTAVFQRLKQCGGVYYGMDDAALEEYLHAVRNRIEDIADQFSAEANQLHDPSELMAEASRQLVTLAARENVANLQATARYQAAEQAKQQIESQNKRLQQHANFDPLTQIHNRVYFDEALSQEAERCRLAAEPLGVIFSDVDQFKQINDNYGHQIGDCVLQRIANVFKQTLRPTDLLARYGGEEFVVLVSKPTAKGLEKLSERIRQRISAELMEFEGHLITVTVSLGAAVDIPGRNCADVGTRVLVAADQEMYRSKRDGGNSSHVRSMVADFTQRLLEQVNRYKLSRWLVAQELLDVPTVSQALVGTGGLNELMGELAVSRGVLSPVDVESILAEQDCTAMRFGETALQLGLLDEEQLVDLLILQKENPFQLASELERLQLLDAAEIRCALEAYLTTRSQILQSPINRNSAPEGVLQLGQFETSSQP